MNFSILNDLLERETNISVDYIFSERTVGLNSSTKHQREKGQYRKGSTYILLERLAHRKEPYLLPLKRQKNKTISDIGKREILTEDNWLSY